MNIEKETRKLMRKDGRSPESLSTVTGLKMRWLYLFKDDKLNDYGVRKVQKLYNKLNKEQSK